jgi:hypothetical protein
MNKVALMMKNLFLKANREITNAGNAATANVPDYDGDVVENVKTNFISGIEETIQKIHDYQASCKETIFEKDSLGLIAMNMNYSMMLGNLIISLYSTGSELEHRRAQLSANHGLVDAMEEHLKKKEDYKKEEFKLRSIDDNLPYSLSRESNKVRIIGYTNGAEQELLRAETAEKEENPAVAKKHFEKAMEYENKVEELSWKV